MFSPLDTRIAFFGGSCNPNVLKAITALAGAGFEVAVGQHDPRETVVLRKAGVEFAANAYDAIAGAQVVITSKRTAAELEDLYLGDVGLLEIVEPGTHCVDVSFVRPRIAREIHAIAAVSDIEFIDAPILNLGDHEQTCVFVGGMPDTQQALSPLFPYFAANVCMQSDVGEGQFAGMMATIALAGSLMGAVEAMAMARISGFPESGALSVLAATAGGSRALVDYIPRMLAHDYRGHINVNEMLDMLDVALDAAEDLDITLPMVETAYQLFDLLAVVGGEELNIQALALLYEDEKTCADYGLDWSLADELNQPPEGYDAGGYYSGPTPNAGPGLGGHSNRGQGPNGGTIPPFDGFFSRN